MFKLITGLLFSSITYAQWSNDPNQNLLIADRPGEEAQPKIVATADGGAYISWFDNTNGGYDVYIQRIDANGTEQWPHNGVLVADRSFTSTQDYGLAIDSNGNALLAFRDDRNANEEITVNAISSTGELLWGTTGIKVNVTTGFLANPKVAGTSDGQVAVAWTQDSDVVVQKLDSNGVAQWGNGITLTATNSSLISSDLKASDQGNVIVSMVESASFQAPKLLWAQKLAAADGASLWGAEPLQVLDSGSLQFGNFPSFITDDSGGAIFSWYTSSPSLNCWVQHINSNGTPRFVQNGVATSTHASQIRTSPSAAYDPNSQTIYTFWPELSSNQAQSGIYGQKFDANGIRQWTDSGRSLVALDNNQRYFIQTQLINDQPMVTWINSRSFNNDIIEGAQVDTNGTLTWTPAITELNSSTAGDSRLASAISGQGFGMYVWSENNNIKAQNLNVDGTLGSDLIFANGFDSLN